MSPPTPTKPVRCAECGGWYELSDRNAREHRRRGTQPRCRDCRRSAKPRPTEPYRRYWIQLLGLDEALEVARMIWPPTDRPAAH